MTDAVIPEHQYSCHTSREEEEPVWAHATRVSAWLCLGYDAAWEAKALPQSNLSPEVIAKLTEFEERVPFARVQFIRQAGGMQPGEIPLLLCRSDLSHPWLRKTTLAAYEDILKMDLASIFQESDSIGEELDPAFLTCINGRRDLCCARYGQAVYDAFAEFAPARSWQTTHLGGHRFAATSIVLPYGLHYGRLKPADAAEIVRLTDRGQLLLDNLRGRTTYPDPVQAAEHKVRSLKNLNGIDDVGLLQLEEAGPGSWRVRLRLRDSEEEIDVNVAERPKGYQVITTTGKPEREWVVHFEATPMG
jgi:hypothetical protein